MRRLHGAALLLVLATLLGCHRSLAVRFGAGLVKRASAAGCSAVASGSGKAAAAEEEGGDRKGRGAEFNAWTQRIKGEIATRWDQGFGQMFNGSSAAVAGHSSSRSKGGSKPPKNGMEEYSGSRTLRFLDFWSRAIGIYHDYKVSQLRIKIQAALIRDPEERERKRTEWWDVVHERNSDKMLDLALSLRGFYLKAGQFLGTRPDFMPMPYIIKLSTLHDRVPPIPESEIRKVLMEELGRPIDEVFCELRLEKPVGSASICQVHEGRLRCVFACLSACLHASVLYCGLEGAWIDMPYVKDPSPLLHVRPRCPTLTSPLRTEAGKAGERVAVKIQYPHAEAVMRDDLANLRRACLILERTDLKFDLSSMCRELQKQLAMEFDFRIVRREGRMDGTA